MNSIKICLVVFITTLFFSSLHAQAPVEKQTIKVYGNYAQCKKKIEKNALAAGATFADWNTKTKKLNVSYDPSVTNIMKIETQIAGAGYDTKDVEASDSAYSQLDDCCQYARKN